jgi:hypothetical protein
MPRPHARLYGMVQRSMKKRTLNSYLRVSPLDHFRSELVACMGKGRGLHCVRPAQSPLFHINVLAQFDRGVTKLWQAT